MSVTIKSVHEIELMREAGRLLNIVHKELEAAIRPGISTWELDKLGERVIRGFGCVPNFLNYNGFPASFCISMTRSYTESGAKRRFSMRAISSALTQD